LFIQCKKHLARLVHRLCKLVFKETRLPRAHETIAVVQSFALPYSFPS
jgi:hypothetical protein